MWSNNAEYSWKTGQLERGESESKLFWCFFFPANYPILPGRIKKNNLTTISVLFFPTAWFKNCLFFLCFFFPLLPCKESLMRHICLFPWYFKERLLAESKEIYRIKQGTNVCSLVTDINVTFRINYIEIFFYTCSKWNHVSHFLLWCKVWCFTEKNICYPVLLCSLVRRTYTYMALKSH